MPGPVVDQLLVNFIGHHDQVVLLGDVGQLLQGLPRLDHAGGVARGVDDQHPGLGGDEALNLV